MTDPPQFEVGDLVRLKRGWTAMEVVHLTSNYLVAAYSPEAVRDFRKWQDTGHGPIEGSLKRSVPDDFVHWDTSVRAPYGKKYVNRFKHQTRHIKETEEMPKKETLYSWTTREDKTGEKFGTHIGTMPDGRWVMAPAGGGEPIVGRADEFTEVVPYSILLENTSERGQRPIHVWADKEDNIRVGQMIIWTTGDVMIVRDIDTKSKDAFQWVEGMLVEGRILKPKT